MTSIMKIGDMPDDIGKLIQDFARPNKVRWEVMFWLENRYDRDFYSIKHFYDEKKAYEYYDKCVDEVINENAFKTQIFKQEYDQKNARFEGVDIEQVCSSNCDICGRSYIIDDNGDQFAYCENCDCDFCLDCVKWNDEERVFYCLDCCEEANE